MEHFSQIVLVSRFAVVSPWFRQFLPMLINCNEKYDQRLEVSGLKMPACIWLNGRRSSQESLIYVGLSDYTGLRITEQP